MLFTQKQNREESFVKITATTCVTLVVELHSSYFVHKLTSKIMN